MNNRRSWTIFWVAIMALGLALPPQSIFAQGTDAGTQVTTPKRHKVQRPRHQRAPNSVGYSCAYDRAAGACMMDLGYGRCMPCSAGPMK